MALNANEKKGSSSLASTSSVFGTKQVLDNKYILPWWSGCGPVDSQPAVRFCTNVLNLSARHHNFLLSIKRKKR